MDIEKIRTSPFHPQGNGQSENSNRTIVQLLITYIDDIKKTRKWDDYLPYKKFQRYWLGPFKVLARFGEVNYAIGTLDGRKRKVVHANLLKKAHERPKYLKYNEIVRRGQRKDHDVNQERVEEFFEQSSEEEEDESLAARGGRDHARTRRATEQGPAAPSCQEARASGAGAAGGLKRGQGRPVGSKNKNGAQMTTRRTRTETRATHGTDGQSDKC